MFGFRIRTPVNRKWGRSSVVAAGDGGRSSDIAGKLGVEPGMVVQELGWDEDVDEVVHLVVGLDEVVDGGDPLGVPRGDNAGVVL